MKLEHLGKIIEIEPRQAALENRIVRMLNKHSAGVRQSRLFILTQSGRLGAGIFHRSLDRLVNQEDVVKRVATDHENSFLLKLTSWGEEIARDLEQTIAERTISLT